MKSGSSFPPVGSLDGLRPMLLALEEIKPSGRSQIEQALHSKRRKKSSGAAW